MGDSPGILSFRFDHEDRVQRARTKIDTNQDHIVSDAELASNPSEKQNLDTLLPGVKPPLTSPTTQEYLKSGSGVVSNRSLFSIPHKDAGADITEMNIGDASNSQRLRAAGLTEAQLYNPNNIFVHLGQKDGKEQYGFYSKGFGEGDERAGVVTVGADGKISSSLGAGWSAADTAQQTQLKQAFEARAKLVSEKFGGDFQAYKKFETARAQVDDLLARGDVTGDARNNLTSLKTDMAKTSETGFNASSLQARADNLLKTHSTTLQQIRQAEAAGKVADGANITEEAKLDEALKTQTDKVNALSEAENKEYKEALNKFNENLKSLGNSTHLTAESFRKAGEYLKKQDLPQNKQTLGELKWQNARFEKMMKDSDFKAEVEAERNKTTTPATPPTTPPTTTPTSSDNPAIPSTHKSAEEMATELGTKFYEQELLDALSGFPDVSLGAKSDPTGESGFKNFNELFDSLQISSSNNTNELIISQGDKHFLYNRNLQTARSLTPVTGSQDAFYDPSEPSTLLLRDRDQFSRPGGINLFHNGLNYQYSVRENRWDLVE